MMQFNRVRLRRSNTITSRVPGSQTTLNPSTAGLPHHLPESNTSIVTTTNNLAKANGVNGQKAGWSSKFNSMGSTSTASTTPTVASTGTEKEINICLECKDVVDNIGRKSLANNFNVEEVEHKVEITTTKSHIHPLAREMRNLHTRSMIFE